MTLCQGPECHAGAGCSGVRGQRVRGLRGREKDLGGHHRDPAQRHAGQRRGNTNVSQWKYSSVCSSLIFPLIVYPPTTVTVQYAGSERPVPAGAGLHGASEHGDQGGRGLAPGVRRRGQPGHWPGVLCTVQLPRARHWHQVRHRGQIIRSWHTIPIRSLRLNSRESRSLDNIYDPLSGQIIIRPFSYKVLPEAHLWLRKADSFILKVKVTQWRGCVTCSFPWCQYCSTSPAVEPPHFCDHMRSKFRRMISDPAPDTLFPGGRARLYTRNAITGQWILEMTSEGGPGEAGGLWAGADLRIQFS